MPTQPRILREEVVYSNRWISVYKREVQIGNTALDCYVVGRRQRIAAILAIDADQNVLLTQQYRWAVDANPIDIPGGGVLPDEEPIDAARRELLEETGCRAGQLELLATRYLDSGQKDCVQYIFVATELTPGARRPDCTEDIKLLRRSLQALQGEILAGAHQESTLMIAVLFHLAKEAL